MAQAPNLRSVSYGTPTPPDSPAAFARKSAVRLRVQLPATTPAPPLPASPSAAAPAVVPAAPAAPVLTPATKSATDLFQMEARLLAAMQRGDAAGALTLASVLVYACPEHEVARAIKVEYSRPARQATRTFPEPNRVPRMCVPWSELTSHPLSRREAYMLSCIDGRLSVADLVDVCAMSPLVAYGTLDALVSKGLVELQ